MELSGLAKLGKIGGVAGIGLGMVVLVFGDVLKGLGVLPENWRGPILVLIILSVAALAGGALAGWILRQRSAAQIAKTEGNNSEARNENASKDGARQKATTKGNNAPSVNIRR
jgi:hypothetical protein